MPAQSPSNHTVASADGTEIGYRRLGKGRGLVIVHGSINTSEDWLPAADVLASDFTVLVMDRRGRGLSADAAEYTLQTEADDIRAVLNEAGEGAALLGHSYGAICALEAVRTGAVVTDLVLYEPPLPVDGPVAGSELAAYATAIAAGDPDKALRIASKHFLRISAEETEGMAASPLWEGMKALAPTWTRELREIDLCAPRIAEYDQLDERTLLLLGSVSPSHLTAATHHLEEHLPQAGLKILPGQSHFAHVMDPAGTAAVISAFLRE
jgi:pimeloyl-ACP methyl ester carboxylesterase